MIICRTPYRIPLAGGGTDHSFYYKYRTGLFITATFDQYIYTAITKRQIDNKILIQTTDTQFCNDLKNVKHEIIKSVLKYFDIKNKIHITSFATIPTQSGVGSSSALIVGLVNSLCEYKKIKISKDDLMRIAFKIERKILKYKGGYQDQIASAFGGFRKVSISKKGKIKIKEIKINKNKIDLLNKKMILVFTNETRDSSKVIKSQEINKKKILQYYDKIKSYVGPMEKALKNGDYKTIGKIFDDHWNLKKKLTPQMSNVRVNKIYSQLKKDQNIIGGKLIGAGGGGFYLCITKNQNKSINFLKKNKLNFIKINFENKGSKIFLKN